MSEQKKDIGAWDVQCWKGKLPDGKVFFITKNEFKKENDKQPPFKISLGNDFEIPAWEKTAKDGVKKFWGGKFSDGRFFSIFLNTYKTDGDRQPTFNILINEGKVQTVSFAPEATKVEDDLPF